MKKMIFAIGMATVVGFTAAVGMCVRVLTAVPVGAFEAGTCIVLDAGHGGIDGGVVGKTTGVKESDLNLSITYTLKAELESLGFEVELTRKTEAGLYDSTAKGFKRRDMEKRREIIRERNPAMVLSIHQNFYPSPKTRGAQVFYSPKIEGSSVLAEGLQTKLNDLYAKVGVKGRKVTKAEFFMLECADCPSVIIECGFLSNARDEALLQEEAWQKQLAETISSGVLSYFSRVTI